MNQQNIQPEFNVRWSIDVSAENHLEAAHQALTELREKGSTATVFEVQQRGSKDTVTLDLDAPKGEEILKDERQYSAAHMLEVVLARINADLQLARELAVEPFSLKINEVIDVEFRPASENDQRILVGRQGWGFTTVNYTQEGCIVDVVAEGTMDSEQTFSIPKDALEAIDESATAP